ncbi:hypothetical protein ALC57_17484, partial [Trachymyrmex cornetzi]
QKNYLKMRRNFYDGGLTCSTGLISLTCLLLVLSLTTSIIAAPFEHEMGDVIPDLTVSNDNAFTQRGCPLYKCVANCPLGYEVCIHYNCPSTLIILL